MALIKCPECGKKISDKSTVCIHCGCPIENTVNENVEVTETITVDTEKCETAKKVMDKAKLKKIAIIASSVVGAIAIIAILLFFLVLKPTYEDATVIYNDAVAIYNEKVTAYEEKSSQIAAENQKLTAVIDELQSIVSSGEKPYDPNAIPAANTAINEGKIALIEIPKWEDKGLKAAEDYNIFQAGTMKKDSESVKAYTTELTGIIESMQIPDHTEVIEVVNKGKEALEFSIKQMKQVTCPSESFVLERVTNIRDQAGMTDVIALTEDNDPENYIGKAGWYTAKIIFRHKDVEHYGLESGLLTLSEVGNPAGGCVEVYRTEEDAQRRADELKSQEGTARSPGARVICGTMVIRVSDDLKTSYQQELLTLITNEMLRLDDGEDNQGEVNPEEKPSQNDTQNEETKQEPVTETKPQTQQPNTEIPTTNNNNTPKCELTLSEANINIQSNTLITASVTGDEADFPNGITLTANYDDSIVAIEWGDWSGWTVSMKIIPIQTGSCTITVFVEEEPSANKTISVNVDAVKSPDDDAAQAQLAFEAAEAFRQNNQDRILSVYELYEHLSGLGYSDAVCEEVCFGNTPEGFDDGSAMYDYERIIKFSNQGYSRDAIINYYLGSLSYEDAAYLVDECLSGRKLTYEYVDGSLELVEH